jgi:hypothetical protein
MADRYEYSDKGKTQKMRLAFVKIFDKPDVDQKTGRKTWNLTGILQDPSHKAAIDKLVLQAATKLWGEQAKTRLAHPKCKLPFKTGKEMAKVDGERYNGFEDDDAVNVKFSSSQGAPGVVSSKAQRITDWDGTTLIDKEADVSEVIEANAIYSGMFGRVSYTAQAYQRTDGFGVSLKLENLQKMGDGERLSGGRAKAEDDFEAIEADNDDNQLDNADFL